MDQGLFKKHILTIQKVEDNKQEICSYIKERTGLLIQEKDVLISGKKIVIHVSSVVRSFLIQKNIEGLIQEKGYTLSL
jgi:hypothetical protein